MIEFVVIGLFLVVIGMNSEIVTYYKGGKNALIKDSVLIGAIFAFLILLLAALFIYFIAMNQPTQAIFVLLVNLIIIYHIAPPESK